MATLQESIAVDLSRWREAGKSWEEIADLLLANTQIREGLELREKMLIERAGRGLSRS